MRLNFGDERLSRQIGLSTAEFYRKLRTEMVLRKPDSRHRVISVGNLNFCYRITPRLSMSGLACSLVHLAVCRTAAQRGHIERSLFSTPPMLPAENPCWPSLLPRQLSVAESAEDHYVAAGKVETANRTMGHCPRN